MQAFIVRVTLPPRFDDLITQVRRHGDDTGESPPMSDLQSLVESESVNWSVPKHTMVGDVVFFQVSANAGDRARKYRPLLDDLIDDRFWLGADAAVEYAAAHAGGIIAVGRVTSMASSGIGVSPHVSSRSFAPINDLGYIKPNFRVVGHALWSTWPEFQPSGPVQYRQFSDDGRYRLFVAALSDYVNQPLPGWMTGRAVTTGAGPVSKSTWMEKARKAEAGYATEAGVRQMYADWLLRDLSDGRRLYEEADAIVNGQIIGHPDYVIYVNGVPVPVEAKIRAATEAELIEQLNRYRNAPTLRKGGHAFPPRSHEIVILVDQDGIYLTDSTTLSLPEPAIRRQDTTDTRIAALRTQLESLVTREG